MLHAMSKLRHVCTLLGAVTTLALPATAFSGEMPDLSTVPPDLTVPPVMMAEPAAGKRVPLTTQGWEGTQVHHTLYLPVDWKPDARLPVLVEYAGNGGYRNKFGDVSDGSVEGSKIGYGLSGGKGFIWVCMPFVEVKDGAKSNAVKWWGDVSETKRYCLATVRAVCRDWGGDAGAVVLCGFSRGSIACNYIGLHDDEMAGVWRAFLCYSHYDGVITTWPYAGADRASALERLKRLAGRPQFICMENGVEPIRDYLSQTGITGDFTFTTIPFHNHNDAWTLRDIPERRAARGWLQRVVARP